MPLRLFFFLLFSFAAKIFAQNLVPNGDFESMAYCPNTFGQLTVATSWSNAANNWNPLYGTDYMNSCNTGLFGVPTNVFGSQAAHSGSGYVSQASMAPTISNGYRENIYTKLTTTMVIGATYSVSAFTSHADGTQKSSNNMGVKFSGNTSFPVNNISHVYSPSIISNSTVWTQITGTFVADSAYQYVGYGNFFTDASTSTIVSCFSGCTYDLFIYYVDDIWVSLLSMPTPTLTIHTASAACYGGTGGVTVAVTPTLATGQYSYIWSGSSQTTSSITGLVPGIYTVTVTSPSIAAAQSATFQINEPPPLSINSAGNYTACAGSSIQLNANASGGTPGYSYTWVNGGTSSTNTVSQNTAGTTIYTVMCTDANNCGATNTLSTTFLTPTITISGGSACANVAAIFTASGATSYIWLPGNIASPSYTAPPGSSSVYTVIGTDAATSCTAAAIASVIPLPPPPLNLVSSGISCSTLGSATISSNGAYSYTWYPIMQTSSVAINLYPGTYTVSVFDPVSSCISSETISLGSSATMSVAVLSSAAACYGNSNGSASVTVYDGSGTESYAWSGFSGTQPTVTGLNAGTYTITVTDQITHCISSQVFMINQPPALLFSLNISAFNVCTGSTVSMSAMLTGGTPGYSYSWTPGPAASSQTISSQIAGNFIYTISAHDQHGCAVSSTTAIHFATTPTVTVSNATVCSNATATLNASGAATYQWLPSGGAGAQLTVSPAASSVYTVMGNINGCTASAVASIIVNAIPNASITMSPTLCTGQAESFSCAATGSYMWTGPASFNSTLQNPVLPFVSAANAGVYHLLVTSAAGCTASASSTLVIRDTLSLTASGAQVCIGGTAHLHAYSGANYIYTWSGPNGFSSTQPDISILNAGSADAGNYTVMVSIANSCNTYSVVSLVVLPSLTPTAAITSNTKLCTNSDLLLTGSGGGSYFWSGPQNFYANTQTVTRDNTVPGMSGIYSLRVSNSQGCVDTATTLVTVFPLPSVTVTSEPSLCFSSYASFKFISGADISPIDSYSIMVNGTRVSDTTKFYYANPGTYAINAIYQDTNNCVNSSYSLITLHGRPKADFFIPSLYPLAQTETISLINTSIGDDQVEWQWFFEDQPQDTVKTKNASHIFASAESYPVTMTVKNKWGCEDTILKIINVFDDFSIYIPNAFTPNGDNTNDLFEPKGTGINSYHIHVFDRWGMVIFESDNINLCWNGTYRGNTCPNDNYVWKIDITSDTGKTKSYSGFVTLIR